MSSEAANHDTRRQGRLPVFVILGAVLAPLAIVALGVALALRVLGGSSDGTVFGQPTAERRQQMGLPHSSDPVWSILRETKVSDDEAAGVYRASYPAAVKALDGRTLTVAGYLLPLQAGGAGDHFLLSKYTPVCFFCPPGQPNEVIEVHSEAPIVPDERQVALKGRFSLGRTDGSGLFFHLDQATVEG